MKVWGHMLSNTTNEGTGGYAVNLDNGLICFFSDFEKVKIISIDLDFN